MPRAPARWRPHWTHRRIAIPMDRRLIRLLYHHGLDNRPVRCAMRAAASRMTPPRLVVTECDVPVRGLPAETSGLRILHLSDLHLRPGSEVALQLPEAVAAYGHDLVVYTGDLIDSDAAIDPVLSLLARMPRTAPAFAVLGDHDHWARRAVSNDVPRLCDGLAQLAIEVLCNESATILGGALHIVGVDDPVTGKDDIDGAMARVPRDACALLLAHSPDIVARLRWGYVNLVLAGHTHGGQIRLPLVGPLVRNWQLPRRLATGLHWYRGTPVFVNQGIGYSGIDCRIRCPPQAALLTLRTR